METKSLSEAMRVFLLIVVLSLRDTIVTLILNVALGHHHQHVETITVHLVMINIIVMSDLSSTIVDYPTICLEGRKTHAHLQVQGLVVVLMDLPLVKVTDFENRCELQHPMDLLQTRIMAA